MGKAEGLQGARCLARGRGETMVNAGVDPRSWFPSLVCNGCKDSDARCMPTLSNAEPFVVKIPFSGVSTAPGLIWGCDRACTRCPSEKSLGGT